MDRILDRLKEFESEDARYAYADTVTNAFLTAQIKALREERGLTQEQLADRVGTQQSGISRWLNSGFSSCKVETLRKFARAYGIRLRISFEPFGTLPTDVGGFTKERLAPPKFEDDPAFKEPVPEAKQKAALATKGTLWKLANLRATDQVPTWDTRLEMAEEILNWYDTQPRLAQAPIEVIDIPARRPPKGVRPFEERLEQIVDVPTSIPMEAYA